MFSRRNLKPCWLLASFLASFSIPALGQEGAPGAAGDAYKPQGPQLFPLYQHYLRTADNTNLRNVLYLYNSTDNPDGSWSHLILPLLYLQHGAAPLEDRFYLFPLLYFHKASEAESYNYSVPFFFDRRTPDSSFQMFFPFWARSATEGQKLSRQNFLFPLLRSSEDLRDPSQPVSSFRFGLWRLLEFWESRTSPNTASLAALNFFNWDEETQSGLAAYRSDWVREAEALHGRTYLFPFYFHEEEPDWERLSIIPFYWRGKDPRSDYLWLVPFFGYWQGPANFSLFIIPLLSGFGAGPGEERGLGILFPLFGYRGGPKSFGLLTFPFFDYERDPEGTSFGILLWLYRSRYEEKSGKRTHSILFPLSHFDVEPDGSQGSRWFFPYIETFNQDRLWRFVVPLYFEKQNLAGGKTDWFFRLGLPAYFSYGSPTDYFSLGFPLYWASRDGPRGWQLFLPFFLHSYSATSTGMHIFPLFSYRNFPSQKQFIVGGPLYAHTRSYDLEERLTGVGNYFLWPFTAMESREDGYHYRLFPLFWISRQGENRDLLLSPFYYQQTGPAGTQRYFIPFYGRYQTQTLTHDYYALATYIRTRENDEAGSLARTRHDVLWGLASFENDIAGGGSHQHVLPVGYWNTSTAAEERTVAGPFLLLAPHSRGR